MVSFAVLSKSQPEAERLFDLLRDEREDFVACEPFEARWPFDCEGITDLGVPLA